VVGGLIDEILNLGMKQLTFLSRNDMVT
jgi:hypothetical protein